MQYGPKIVRSGLVLHLDAGDRQSCSGAGATVWKDLSGNSEHFTLYNSPSFNSSYGGELRFDGSNDYARRRNSNIVNNSMDAILKQYSPNDRYQYYLDNYYTTDYIKFAVDNSFKVESNVITIKTPQDTTPYTNLAQALNNY